MPYPIWASDAVLLGRALEEYLQANDDTEVYFLDFLWSRLSPFYPPINFRLRRELAKIADTPHDIAWEPIARIPMRVGFSPGLPNSWFLGAFDKILRITLDKPVRHLMDEVAELVAECVARNPADDAKFHLALDAPWGKVQQLGFAYASSGSARSRATSDDPEKIETLLEELVAQPSNNCSEFFRIGRSLGLVLAHCHRYEWNFLKPLYEASLGDEDEDHEDRDRRFDQDDEGFTPLSADYWRSYLAASLQALLEDPMLGHFSNAGRWLALEEARLDDQYDPGDLPTEFRKLATIRSAVWLAFGEILHAAQCTEEARPDDGRPRIPRMLKIAPLTAKSTNDEIRDQIILLEETFDRGSIYLSPKQMVASVIFAVEALARRAFPEQFASSGPKPRVLEILSARIRLGDDQEKRFASTAMMLYTTYRNEPSHAFDGFECTWQGAMHVFWSLR